MISRPVGHYGDFGRLIDDLLRVFHFERARASIATATAAVAHPGHSQEATAPVAVPDRVPIRCQKDNQLQPACLHSNLNIVLDEQLARECVLLVYLVRLCLCFMSCSSSSVIDRFRFFGEFLFRMLGGTSDHIF